jgi:hypothetical protein
MIEKTLQDERRECLKDHTVETQTVTVNEETKPMLIGQRIVDGALADLPPMTLPPMATPVNVNVIDLIGTFNNEGISIWGVGPGEAEIIIWNVLSVMKAQATNLRDWFAAAKESYPTKFYPLLELEGKEVAIAQGIQNGVAPAVFHSSLTDYQKGYILNELFQSGSVPHITFTKYLNAYTKGQYLATRDWTTDMNGLAGERTAFLSALNEAQTQATADGLSLPSPSGDWTDSRGVIIYG